MERFDHRPTRSIGRLTVMTLAAFAACAPLTGHAALTEVTAFASSQLHGEARTGTILPPSTLTADNEDRSYGDSAAVAGLPALNAADVISVLTAYSVTGYSSSRADARGGVYRSGEIVGDSLSATLIGSSQIDVTASVLRSRSGEPTNVMAEATATASSTQRLSFTLTSPSAYNVEGHLSAFGPATGRAWLVEEGSGLVIFDGTAAQTQYDPSGFSTTQAIYAMGILPPGKYALWASTVASALVQEVALSVRDGLRTQANAYFGVQFNLIPVPLPAAAWMMLTGLALVCVTKPRRRHPAVESLR